MKRAIYVNCDGLCTDWITEEHTPTLARLSAQGVRCAQHRAVFPSVTRASAASIATGCRPIRHGLHGNRMGLIEDGRLVVRDVGPPDFREHMRKALGRTLRVPTMAQRVAKHGGFVAYSNVSPGAAYFLDPEEHGEVRHRAGTNVPAGTPRPPALPISAGLDGDAKMAAMFCEALVENPRAVSVLWFGDPDLTMHNAPIGSPTHLAALRRIDGLVGDVVAAVEALRGKGQDILLAVGADHGHETVGQGINVSAWLDNNGFAKLREAGQMAFATQGTAALLYAIGDGAAAVPDALAKLEAAPWVERVATGAELEQLGIMPENGLVAGITLARDPTPNAFGIAGQRWASFSSDEFKGIGYGQHGGLGPDETRPFLILSHPENKPARRTERSSLIDIAPTFMTFLGLPVDGMEGKAIGWR
jgi:arylsulfatase A-like enzyme